MELEKLRLFKNNSAGTIDKKDILSLVNASNQSSLQLASAILKRETGKALELVNELLNRNENPLAITATLGGQFRTWAIVKLKIEEGEKDEKNIAAAAEIANPKRLYFMISHLLAIPNCKTSKTLAKSPANKASLSNHSPGNIWEQIIPSEFGSSLIYSSLVNLNQSNSRLAMYSLAECHTNSIRL